MKRPTQKFGHKKRAANSRHKPKGWDPYIAGNQVVERLKQAEGGAIPANEAAHRLGINLSELEKRIADNEIVAWTDMNGRRQFPLWQFAANDLLPGVRECLQILGSVDEWAIMRFFLYSSESAGNISPLTLLRHGRQKDAMKIANGLVETGRRQLLLNPNNENKMTLV